MRFILTIALALTGSFASAQINGTDGKASTLFTNNFVKNPSAATNNFYVVTNSATATRDTNASNKVDGKASWLIDTSANGGFAQWDFLPESSEVTSGGNCAFRGIFKGDASLYAAKVTDGLGNLIFQVPLTNESGWREFIVPVTCATTGGNRRVRIEQIVAGTSPAINVGKVSWGRYEAQFIQPPNTFTASITTTGTVSRQTPYDWLSCVTSGTTNYVCTYLPSFGSLTSNTNCNLSVNDSAGSAAISERFLNRTLTGFTVQAQNAASTRMSVMITCTKTGTDYAQPALTVQDMDYGPRPFTPTIVGFGTVTNQVCDEARVNNYNVITCKFTAGTPTAVTASITLPYSRLADVRSTGLFRTFGTLSINSTTASSRKEASVLIENGNGTIRFGDTEYISTNGGQVALTGNAFVGSVNMTVSAWVPIQGWGAVTAPPIAGLVGSSNLNVSHRFEYGSFGGGTVRNSNCAASSTCTKWSDSAGGTTVTSDAVPTFTVTFAKPFGRAPDCQCSCVQYGTSARACNQLTSSVGVTSFQCTNGQGLVYPGGVSYQCSGPAN